MSKQSYITKKEGENISIICIEEGREYRIAIIPRWYKNDIGIANGIIEALKTSKVKLDLKI